LNLKCERIGGKCTYGCISDFLGSDCSITALQTINKGKNLECFDVLHIRNNNNKNHVLLSSHN
jgi:hypothetical protein